MLVVVVVQLLARDFLRESQSSAPTSFLVLDNIHLRPRRHASPQSNHLKHHHTTPYYLAVHQGYLDIMHTVCRSCLQLMRR